jgi:hypothetical protein
MLSASDLQRTDWLIAADSRLLTSEQREQFGRWSNMCYVYVTWGRTKECTDETKITFRNMLKKGWFVANFIVLCGCMRRWAFFVFSRGLQKVCDSSWTDLDLISRGKLWIIDHRVVTMQRPDKIIVLQRIWGLRLITKLNVKTLAWNMAQFLKVFCVTMWISRVSASVYYI